MIQPYRIYRNKKATEAIGYMPEIITHLNGKLIMDGYDMDISNNRKHFSIRKNQLTIDEKYIDDWEEVKQAYSTTIYGNINDNYEEK